MAPVKKSTATESKRVKLTTPVFRMFFPTLFVPRAFEGDDDGVKKFSVIAIWNPVEIKKAAMKSNATDFAKKEWALYRKMLVALDAKANENFQCDWADMPARYHRGLRDGDEREGTGGFTEDVKFANLATTNKPGVVGPTIDEDTGKFYPIGPEHGNADEVYSGCYGRATVSIWGFNKKSKGLAFGLFNVQKLKDGDRLDNRTKAEDDFDDDLDAEFLDNDGDDDGDDADDDFG